MECTFCATGVLVHDCERQLHARERESCRGCACAGTMGLKGNLTAGEILEQLLHANAITPIHNVVFMVRLCPGSWECLPLCAVE